MKFISETGLIFFPSLFFAAKPQKNKYRWFKVERFGGGGLVGGGGGGRGGRVRCHKGLSPVTLPKTLRNHVNAAAEASSSAKLFASEIYWFN